ncbi:23S rRNA (pseudouridine(1915)-N(3))-methyltransferase RlmH [candidate division KSB1 bacterium]|nr:23S rRNA (pseudouridine(1915)-N(3))-methyltransferase RlmH [candidate division KSB1 bacterium]
MNLAILAVGKLREPYYKAGVQDYLERIARWLPIEQLEVAVGTSEESNGKGTGTLVREADQLEKQLQRPGIVVAMDVLGKQFSTEQFSAWIVESMNRSIGRITFVIGGAWGLDRRILEQADLRLSLSAMTLPHELARLVLAEQIYRALSLWKNLPYHKQ